MALPAALLVGCAANPVELVTPSSQLAFGVEMAQRGLWQEALFRFRQAEQASGSDPRVLNNLAVAYEATGDFDRALEVYKRALAAAPDNRDLKRNYSRFVEFYQSFRPKAAAAEAAGGVAPTPPTPPTLSAGNAPSVPGSPAPPRLPPEPPSPVDPGEPADPGEPGDEPDPGSGPPL